MSTILQNISILSGAITVAVNIKFEIQTTLTYYLFS